MPSFPGRVSGDAASGRLFISDTKLFGWDFTDQPTGPDGIYTFLQKNGQNVAALYALTEDQRAKGVPPYWMPYFGVDDCDAAVARAVARGGQVHAGPIDVPGVGRFAALQDPQGAAFSIIAMTHFA